MVQSRPRPDIDGGLAGWVKADGLVAVALALVMQALVPAGFMPAIGADGVYALDFCTGNGPVRRLVDANGAPVEGADHDGVETCPLAGAVPALPASAPVPVPRALPATVLPAPVSRRLDCRAPGRPALPRAPPFPIPSPDHCI